MRFYIGTLDEELPDKRWAEFFARVWPGYRAWFLTDGARARPSYLASTRALRAHMPELWPVYERLCELAGGSDDAARCLSLYRPAQFLSACSQAVWTRGDPVLVRNYDYSHHLWDRVLTRSNWRGRRVMGMSDCLWGLLDGMNEAGLSMSLAFGGRKVVGDGFGIPLILRYALEVCGTTKEAVRVLQRVPSHMAYSVTVLDATGAHATVFVGPDAPAVVTRRAAVTNHQHRVEWPEHAEATGSVDRLYILNSALSSESETEERFIRRFLEPPTYGDGHDRGLGTLYTAVYRPRARTMSLLWPGARWDQSLQGFSDRWLEVITEADAARAV